MASRCRSWLGISASRCWRGLWIRAIGWDIIRHGVGLSCSTTAFCSETPGQNGICPNPTTNCVNELCKACAAPEHIRRQRSHCGGHPCQPDMVSVIEPLRDLLRRAS